MSPKQPHPELEALRSVLDERTGVYKELAGLDIVDLGAYLGAGPLRDDEEILTEPILARFLERVLGFPPDGYFPQLGKSGLKPDFTPMDLIAHPFVLDAKSSRQRLQDHEQQIRNYVDQRQLDFGILFNLREIAVYRRGVSGPDPTISFSLEALWRMMREEAQPAPELEAFERFVALFSFKSVGREEKIDAVRNAQSWEERGKDVELRVDVDLLVEQLRRLSRLLADDAESQPEVLADHAKVNPGFEERLLAELAAIAQDIRPRTVEGNLPDSVLGYREGSGFEQRVWRQYAMRVSQLTLARILLYRAWEDAGFIREQLYDGGFRDAYTSSGEKVREVLRDAFIAGAQRYHWLFEQQTTYDWYRPREDPLVEVLYSFTQFPLDRLDADVLGGLYESYVDEIDRDRLGQFYTPRAVVKFMLDRAGFSGPDGVMRIEGDSRVPMKTFDFASGSGGFDVEIARRVIDDSGALEGDSGHQFDALSAIASGLHAIEISPFPYYLTEINLLLQVSRLLGALSHAGQEIGSFVLSVVHEDALKAKRGQAASLEGLDAEHRADHALLKEDERFGLSAQLDPEKQAAFTRIREGGFDLVIGNPPYVAEANNKPLFERLRQIDAWDGIYRGKSDYYYYFLYMAAEMLAPGGRLCAIVPASWMNAGGADWLREKLAGTLRLDELFLFGGYRLFAPEAEARARVHRAPTPTVESAILVATRADVPKGHKLRVVALEDEPAAARTLSGDSEINVPDRDQLLKEMASRAVGRQGRKGGIHVHSILQRDLVAYRPWPVKHSKADLAQQVVDVLDAKLTFERMTPLGEMWTIVAGIETGADAFTPRIRQRLERQFPDVLRKVLANGATPNAPILQLDPGVEDDAPWNENSTLLAHSPEARAILYGAVDSDDYTNLVWLTPEEKPSRQVLEILEPWKALLEVRAGNIEAPDKPWWATHRPRDKAQLRRPKVVGVHRTDRGRFAVDSTGEIQSGKSGAMVIFKSGTSIGPVSLLCGYLNSELLDLWYSVRGRTARDIWRDYEPKPMSGIPYRHIEFPQGPGSASIKNLKVALGKQKLEAAASHATDIASGLRAAADAGLATDAPEAIEAARALEAIVEAIADNRRALLPYRDRFPELTRVVKDPWSREVVDPYASAFVSALPKKRRASVRVDPELKAEIHTNGALGRMMLEDGRAVFRYRRQVVAEMDGPSEKLMLLSEVLVGATQLMPKDLLSLELPRDVVAFRAEVEAATAEVARLLAEGNVLVEAAERLVCALYGVPAELEDEVVAHAIARANPPIPEQ
jgi:Eco57I restriction-modification methylase/N-6 DNA Methylase